MPSNSLNDSEKAKKLVQLVGPKEKLQGNCSFLFLCNIAMICLIGPMLPPQPLYFYDDIPVSVGNIAPLIQIGVQVCY